MKVTKMIEEKQEEEDLIKIRIVEEIVLRRFYKYLKMFEKNESEKMLISQKKICSKKEEDIFTVKNRKKGGLGVFKESVEKVVYLTIKVTTDITGVLCAKKR